MEIEKLYHILLEQMGPQGWWPADSELEMVIGAILVQNTNWNNVVKSLANIERETKYDAERLLEFSPKQIEEMIRPSGFHKNKAKAIRTIVEWLGQHQFDYQHIDEQYGADLRNELLKLHGVGPETADVLLVFLFNRVEFIPDSYTRRLFKRLGYNNTDQYNKFKKEVVLPDSFTNEMAKEFHGLLDEFGKLYLMGRSVKPSFLDEYFVE